MIRWIKCQVFELTQYTWINSRWTELPETPEGTIAHDKQSLDSGPEGPDELETAENNSSPSGKAGVSHFSVQLCK